MCPDSGDAAAEEQQVYSKEAETREPCFYCHVGWLTRRARDYVITLRFDSMTLVLSEIGSDPIGYD